MKGILPCFFSSSHNFRFISSSEVCSFMSPKKKALLSVSMRTTMGHDEITFPFFISYK